MDKETEITKQDKNLFSDSPPQFFFLLRAVQLNE
jgi:hypothetical protein